MPKEKTSPVTIKRFSMNLPAGSFEELKRLSKSTGYSMSSLVIQGIGLHRIFREEAKRGNKMVVINEESQVVKELVLVNSYQE